MSNTNRFIAMLFVVLVVASATTPLAMTSLPTAEISVVDSRMTVSATSLDVTNITTNNDKDFDDDDFLFVVRNYTQLISGAIVTLFNASDMSFQAQDTTDFQGQALFLDVPVGTYVWNVTWSLDTTVFEVGFQESDGPEAFIDYDFGNLDLENNDDDLNITVTDIDQANAEGLNFSIHFTSNNSIYDQWILDSNGSRYVSNIPVENYTLKVTIPSGDYAGTVLVEENVTADGTTVLVHTTTGQLGGNSLYNDIEFFVYFENSIDSISGALVNVTFKNGTEIATKTTESNGTVRFLDIPNEFVNWTVLYDGEFIDLVETYVDFSSPDYDLIAPTIECPELIEYLVDSSNMTITWHLEDTFPVQIQLIIDGVAQTPETWNTPDYDYVYNATGYDLGNYTFRLIAYDQNGNSNSSTTKLRVYEDVDPVIDSPDDIEFLFSETGNSIRWNITEDNPKLYTVTKDDEVIESGEIDPANPFITIGLEDLAVGVYVYTLTANDTSGNEASDSVTVTVLRDSTTPVLVYNPETIVYALGDRNIVRNWTITDDFKDYYEIYVDTILIETDDWTSDNIEFDFAGLAQGNHTIRLSVYDLGGNSLTVYVSVTVTPPPGVQFLFAFAALGIVCVVAIVVMTYIKNR